MPSRRALAVAISALFVLGMLNALIRPPYLIGWVVGALACLGAAVYLTRHLAPAKPEPTLIDLLAANIRRDPGDAPAVYVEADVMADDMERYVPAAVDPRA